jgi:hypothetical protein
MALSVGPLAGFPAATSIYQATPGTPVDAAYHTFTNGVYTVSGTVYVAGYVDGEERGRMFLATNVAPTVGLPTLTSVTQLTAVDNVGVTQYGGYKVSMSPGANSPDYSSTINLFLDENAVLIIASTQFG